MRSLQMLLCFACKLLLFPRLLSPLGLLSFSDLWFSFLSLSLHFWIVRQSQCLKPTVFMIRVLPLAVAFALQRTISWRC